MKETLLDLSRKLQELHKDLLLFQTKHAEDAPNWQSFAWLQKLSALMTQIDHHLRSAEEIEILDLQNIYDEATRLFHGHYPDFTETYNRALATEPHLYSRNTEIRDALESLQPFIQDMHEMHAQNEKQKFSNTTVKS